MRASMVAKLLETLGVKTDILTTSIDGANFAASLGRFAAVLEGSYLNTFDERQNLDVVATQKNIQRYMRSSTCFRHVRYLVEHSSRYDLIFNDAFHISGLLASILTPKVVNVSCMNTLHAVIDSMEHKRLYRWAFSKVRARAKANLLVTLQPLKTVHKRGNARILNPLVTRSSSEGLAVKRPLAVIYLNPCFKEASIGHDIEETVKSWGYATHKVGAFAGWMPSDPRLNDMMVEADLIISSASTGVIGHALSYKKKMIALKTEQPEHLRHLDQIKKHKHIVPVDVNDPQRFRYALNKGMHTLSQQPDMDCPWQEVQEKSESDWLSVLKELLAP